MKEAFWGTLIVILGIFGIVVVNIFQNVTVDNDRVYYIMKESTEAAAYDALDLTYYRLSGTLRIVDDKFVENLTRRFAQNITIGNYRIVVQDINELPPKVSLMVTSGITSLQGEEFDITNRVDGILETKYSLKEVLEFLDITEDEWEDYTNEIKIEVDSETGENICKIDIKEKEELECANGDLKFMGFGDVIGGLRPSVCDTAEISFEGKARVAKYKYCECGKWIEESRTITAYPKKEDTEWIYTWEFEVESVENKKVVKELSESITESVARDECTRGVSIYVPKAIRNNSKDAISKDENTGVLKPYEPDRTVDKKGQLENYISCAGSNIKVPKGLTFRVLPQYNPPESINRDLTWSTYNYKYSIGLDSVLSLSGEINPSDKCVVNNGYADCLDGIMVTAEEVGQAMIKVETDNGMSATCEIDVIDPKVTKFSCEDIEIDIAESDIIKTHYEPDNALNYNFEFSIDNPEIAEIIGKNTVHGLAKGKTYITMKDTFTGLERKCEIKVNDIDIPQQVFEDISADKPAYPKFKVEDAGGKVRTFNSREEAIKYAMQASDGEGSATVYSLTSDSTTEPGFLEFVVENNNPYDKDKDYSIITYNDSDTIQGSTNIIMTSNCVTIIKYDSNENILGMSEYKLYEEEEEKQNGTVTQVLGKDGNWIMIN